MLACVGKPCIPAEATFQTSIMWAPTKSMPGPASRLLLRGLKLWKLFPVSKKGNPAGLLHESSGAAESGLGLRSVAQPRGFVHHGAGFAAGANRQQTRGGYKARR